MPRLRAVAFVALLLAAPLAVPATEALQAPALAPARCLPLGERPLRRAQVPPEEIGAILDRFRAIPVSEKKGWVEPRYLESLGDLYAATKDPEVLRVWDERLRKSFPAIGRSPHLVQAGMLLVPYAEYLHAEAGDRDLKRRIVAAIRGEIARWEYTWNGATYVFATPERFDQGLPHNQYGAFARALILYAEATGDEQARRRALMLRDRMLAALFATRCGGLAWHYAPERTKIDDVSHGALFANILLTFNRFGYVDDSVIERIVGNVINNAFDGENLAWRIAGNELAKRKLPFRNDRCDRFMPLAAFSTALVERCRPHLGKDRYGYALTSLVAYYPLAAIERRFAALTQ